MIALIQFWKKSEAGSVNKAFKEETSEEGDLLERDLDLELDLDLMEIC